MVFNFIGFNFFNDVYCYICIIKDLTLILLVLFILLGMGIGDWGLPNPQSPIPNPQEKYITNIFK